MSAVLEATLSFISFPYFYIGNLEAEALHTCHVCGFLALYLAGINLTFMTIDICTKIQLRHSYS
jgi:hypothetical protein